MIIMAIFMNTSVMDQATTSAKLDIKDDKNRIDTKKTVPRFAVNAEIYEMKSSIINSDQQVPNGVPNTA